MSKGSNTFAAIQAAVAATIPQVSRAWDEITAEVGRQGSRGAMEIAAMLFNGHGYVQYGPGQNVTSPAQEQVQEAPQPDKEHENDGMER